MPRYAPLNEKWPDIRFSTECYDEIVESAYFRSDDKLSLYFRGSSELPLKCIATVLAWLFVLAMNSRRAARTKI